ncbi:Uncharacterized protein DAT39_008580, partial [Clarias magur]
MSVRCVYIGAVTLTAERVLLWKNKSRRLNAKEERQSQEERSELPRAFPMERKFIALCSVSSQETSRAFSGGFGNLRGVYPSET